MADAIMEIVMPKWGLAMQEGMVASWLVEEGATIEEGQEILDIETSKIANVYESPIAGPLRRIVVQEGETVPVGAVLGVCADASVPDADIDAHVAAARENLAELLAAAEAAAPEPETVDAGGRRIRFLKLGDADGVPLVLVHGYTGDLNNWMFNQTDWAERRTTYAIDLPGHGGSTKEVGEGDVGSLGSVVLDFMDALDIGKAHLVGHSLGGAISLDLALNHPDRVASATLLGSAGLGPEINIDYVDGFMQAKRRKQMKPVLALLFADPELISREMIEDVLRFKRLDGVDVALNTIAGAAFAGGRQALQLNARLGELSVPVQVIWGREDRILPVAHCQGLPDGIRVSVFDGAGHMIHMEKAAEVNELVERFISA